MLSFGWQKSPAHAHRQSVLLGGISPLTQTTVTPGREPYKGLPPSHCGLSGPVANRNPEMPSTPDFLILAFLWSCTCFHGTDSAAKLPPSVSIPRAYTPLLGQKLTVSCQGYTAFPSSGIIYWLANETFVHDLYSEEEVLQEDTVEKANRTGLILGRSLTFRSFTQKDRCTKFECIVVDPSGLAQKALTWETQDPADPKLNRGKKPKKWEFTCVGKRTNS